jgi:ATP synthase F1 complex assembly factor 2
VGKRFHHAPVIAQGTIESMLMARKRTHKPQVGLPHPPTLYEKAEEWTHALDAWHLVALHSICMQAKSFMVGLALLEQHHADSPFSDDMTFAINASRVEEEFQIANWGLVEGQHGTYLNTERTDPAFDPDGSMLTPRLSFLFSLFF